MKHLILSFALITSSLSLAEDIETTQIPSEQELKSITTHLDKGDLIESHKALTAISHPADTRKIHLLKSTIGANHGAKKVSDNGKFIILEGSAWIKLSDNTLIDGRVDKTSVIIIHKKTQVIAAFEGKFEVTTLLN
ncbi:hypothetical protein ACFSW8_13315 [Rubritalea tangerina]|uniref:Organic solvent tolerance-like N-terminal domain-containing protein n=1 Tax=Rubritalea tangerina TaxID=430798 RepID=A0ABW4ZD19_9BACT